MASIPASQVLFTDGRAAIAALQAVGARHVPGLDLVTETSQLGKVHRRFGVMRNPLRAGAVDDPTVLLPFRALLAQAANAAVADRIRRDDLDYCPANKRILAQIRPALLARRLHLPWALRPMNMDFVSLAARLHRVEPFAFGSFYSEGVQVSGTPPAIAIGNLFSLPLSGRAERTLLEPDEDDMLDAKVGLVLEAHASLP